MNSMMAAFNKASEKNSKIKDLLAEADTLHQNKIEERKKRVDVWNNMMTANALAAKERESVLMKKHHDEAEIKNRAKQIWEWVAITMEYCFECGIIFADTEDEARRLIAESYDHPIKVKVTQCDCSRSVIMIASHYE